jgi:hypothetical protein
MSGAGSAKTLLNEDNHKRYRAFTLNNKATLMLPEISSVPWVGASKRQDTFTKIISNSHNDHHIKFILKNDVPHAFLWQTNPEKLKKAVRWGIVKTHSITGKVIATLGQYRLLAHRRAAKGMVSNSQSVKLKLLDLFQTRFEALQELESLINRDNTNEDYENAWSGYINTLGGIKRNIDKYFSDVNPSLLDEHTTAQIKSDLQDDIERTHAYLKDKSTKNRARGLNSIGEFVKQQMIHGLYELQGINQDMSYSRQRYFALTRGELNDFIEDARKEIDDHQPDLRNAVTAKHHGAYSADNNALVTYDFANDQLTPGRERKVLLAISFIEGWDTLTDVNGKKTTVSNESGQEDLDFYAATRWKSHRNLKTSFKSIGFYLLNIIKGIFVSTRPWEEEAWANKNFRLVAADLCSRAKPHEPMWRKPFRFFKKISYAIVDVFSGAYDFGAGLVIRMPAHVVNDWASTDSLPSLNSMLTEVSTALASIKTLEDDLLKKGLGQSTEAIPLSSSKLAAVEYELTAGEQNDILTAMTRGLNDFGSFFAHNIYAKDPVAGLLFTAAYGVGAGALTSSIFGSGYVNWFSNFSHTMGSSNVAAVIAGGSTQAEVFAMAWDGVAHGPSGFAMNALYQCGEDPLTVGAYFVAAYGLGYILANGIAGHPIPWLSEHLRADLGTVPEAGYPIVGAKVVVMLYEALVTARAEDNPQPQLSEDGTGLADPSQPFLEKHQLIIDRFRLVHWLSTNANVLPKLAPKQSFAVSRQIDALFNKADSESLHKLVYPKAHTSIAFKLLSLPLSYIPAILRFVASLLLSLAALALGKPRPWEPVTRATSQLIVKTKRDLSRLLIVTANLLYLPYTLIATCVKMPVYIVTMAIGRVAGLFNAKPAHYLHRAFASVHIFFRSVGEFFYPVKILEDVVAAHPIHTINEVESSYVKLNKQLGRSTRDSSDKPPTENTHGSQFFTPAKQQDPVAPNSRTTVEIDSKMLNEDNRLGIIVL